MQIHGFTKTTLLDYPGTLACVLFTGSCNFRCPYCHNRDLVLCPSSQPLIPEDEIFAYLKKRQGILEGVCITGGEPTLQQDLPDFIEKVKALGYQVKLDTNGYRPDVLRWLLDSHLIDYAAMDIKSDRETYSEVSGYPDLNIHVIESSVSMLLSSEIAYEFRTTIIKEFHTKEVMKNISEWISSCRSYYLQSYRDSDSVIAPGLSACSLSELEEIKDLVQKNIPSASLRGLE